MKKVLIFVMFIYYSLNNARSADIGINNKTLSKAEWTVLVYMDGDNNLETEALNNFIDMAKIGSSDKLNIIVQFDRHPKYNNGYGNWSRTYRFKVMKGLDPLPQNAIKEDGLKNPEVNMGDPKSLEDFVKWGMANYPAKHYMLDIWDHGQGYRLIKKNVSDKLLLGDSLFANPVTITTKTPTISKVKVVVGDPFRSANSSPYKSCSNDETDNDELYNREIQDALTASLGGQKLDLIGFDCCLMAMVETGYGMRNFAKTMVGSEDLEPGSGWQYDDWLGKLNDKLNAKNDVKDQELGKILVNSYKFRYDRQYGDPATTLSAVDLSIMDELKLNIDKLSKSLMTNLNTDGDAIISSRNDCDRFAPDNNFYHIDFTRFCTLLNSRTSKPQIAAETLNLLSTLKKAIILSYAGNSRKGSYGSAGLAIYFPASNYQYINDEYAQGGYEKNNKVFPVEFVQKALWCDFLHLYFQKVLE